MKDLSESVNDTCGNPMEVHLSSSITLMSLMKSRTDVVILSTSCTRRSLNPNMIYICAFVKACDGIPAFLAKASESLNHFRYSGEGKERPVLRSVMREFFFDRGSPSNETLKTDMHVILEPRSISFGTCSQSECRSCTVLRAVVKSCRSCNRHQARRKRILP